LKSYQETVPEKGRKMLATLLIEGNIGGIMDEFTEMEKAFDLLFYSIISIQ